MAIRPEQTQGVDRERFFANVDDKPTELENTGKVGVLGSLIVAREQASLPGLPEERVEIFRTPEDAQTALDETR
jgi:hypothetical protein